jgi:hypothetical protein
MWRPWRKCAGRHKRIFSDDEDAALVSFVRENYIVPGVIFPDPPGLTDEFQPLARAVFGVLKAQAKRLFHARFQANPYGRRTKPEAVADMITAWSLLGESVIENAWDICRQ